MVNVKKTVKCKCGKHFGFDFNTDMQVNEITLDCRCDSCGSTICATFASLGDANSQSQNQPTSPSGTGELWQSTGLGAVATNMFDDKPSQPPSQPQSQPLQYDYQAKAPSQESGASSYPSSPDSSTSGRLGSLRISALKELEMPSDVGSLQSPDASASRQKAAERAKIEETIDGLFKEE